MTNTLYTVGHGARSFDELVRILDEAQIERLVDVRRHPGSRRHPHFARAHLETELTDRYEWWGEVLGGRRTPRPDSRNTAWRDEAFRGYADHLEHDSDAQGAVRRLAHDTERTAVMCAETLWWRCHRRLIADTAALVHEVRVVHLLAPGKEQPHGPEGSARLTDHGTVVYEALL